MKTDFKKIDKIFSEIRKIVVGQDYMIDRLLIGLFTQGHILLEGVPGLAKTLTVKTLSKVLAPGQGHLHSHPFVSNSAVYDKYYKK